MRAKLMPVRSVRLLSGGFQCVACDIEIFRFYYCCMRRIRAHKISFTNLAHGTRLTPAQAGSGSLRICSGLPTFAQVKYYFRHAALQHAEVLEELKLNEGKSSHLTARPLAYRIRLSARVLAVDVVWPRSKKELTSHEAPANQRPRELTRHVGLTRHVESTSDTRRVSSLSFPLR
jgi:hypothetical protein